MRKIEKIVNTVITIAATHFQARFLHRATGVSVGEPELSRSNLLNLSESLDNDVFIIIEVLSGYIYYY